ncbi:hypothetical protein [Pseudomonas putida]|uniref:hypothetical protein n=1 Tax=Pseudomonas putida TaxID=303 RepID=UPI001F518BAF|nr:hypothetical protein [Pseudomonas putida]MCI0915471.1 hypothetical protein [Pseudomonas putida]
MEGFEGFELAYSVQVGDGQMLELLVDEIESGGSCWQISNACGQALSRSKRYETRRTVRAKA